MAKINQQKSKQFKVNKNSQVIFEQKIHRPSGKFGFFKDRVHLKPWIKNKTEEARKFAEHPASRAARKYGGSAGVVLIILFNVFSLFSPKNDFQKIKERLVKNPLDTKAYLALAENFLNHNQYEETEKMLLLAQNLETLPNRTKSLKGKVLGTQDSVQLNQLWERKRSADPQDIQQLIAVWNNILKEKPNYRDGHLWLAVLYYQVYEDQKTKEHLAKALELDPNYEPAKELEKIIKG